MPDTETTTRFNVDISQLKKGIQDAKRQIALANSEFKAASAGMDNWGESVDGVQAKLGQLDKVMKSQQKILDNLEAEYRMVAEEQGENSTAAEKLKIAINNQKAVIGGVQKSIDKYGNTLKELNGESDDIESSSNGAANGISEVGSAATDSAKKADKAAKSLDDMGDSADDAGEKSKGLAGALGNLAATGFAAVTAAAAAAVTAFLGSAEATRELRESAAKVDTAFTEMGFSSETAADTYKDFYAILGDSDQATEAVGNLAKLAKSQEDLTDWTTIATGVYATFGDGLPIEGLTEAANETAKVAKITGPLADAINWATTDSEAWSTALSGNAEALAAFENGVNQGMTAEDAFNEALLACNDESERAQLITSTLTSLYGSAATTYEETAGDILDANRAQAELNESMAAVGEIAEPVMSSLKLLGASLLDSLLPGLEQVGQGFTDLLNGVDGAEETLGTGLSTLLTGVVDKITAMLPAIASVGGNLIISLAQSMQQAAPGLVTTAGEIVITLVNALTAAAPSLMTGFINMIYGVINSLVDLIPDLLSAAIDFFVTIAQALPEILPDLVSKLGDLINKIVKTLTDSLPLLLDGAVKLFEGIIDAIPPTITALLGALPDIIDNLIDFIVKAVPQIYDAAIEMLMAIVEAIPDIVDALTAALPDIIESVIGGVLDAAPQLLAAAITFFMSLVQAIPQIALTLIANMPKITLAVLKGLATLPGKLMTFFKDSFQKPFDAVKNIWAKLPAFFTNLWSSVKKVFGGVGSFFKDAFSKAVSGIKNVFNPLVSFFSSFWSKIVNKFKSVGTKIGDSISGAVKGAINGVLSGAVKIINGFISAINGAIKFINKIPGVKISKLSKLDAPQMYDGGILKRGQVGILEGRGDEAVVPLHNNKKWIRATAKTMQKELTASGSSTISNSQPVTNNYNFNQVNNSPKALSRLEIYRQTQNQLAFAKGV